MELKVCLPWLRSSWCESTCQDRLVCNLWNTSRSSLTLQLLYNSVFSGSSKMRDSLAVMCCDQSASAVWKWQILLFWLLQATLEGRKSSLRNLNQMNWLPLLMTLSIFLHDLERKQSVASLSNHPSLGPDSAVVVVAEFTKGWITIFDWETKRPDQGGCVYVYTYKWILNAGSRSKKMREIKKRYNFIQVMVPYELATHWVGTQATPWVESTVLVMQTRATGCNCSAEEIT